MDGIDVEKKRKVVFESTAFSIVAVAVAVAVAETQNTTTFFLFKKGRTRRLWPSYYYRPTVLKRKRENIQ